jgi:4'-phosphopantetheinyl transferase
MELWLVDLDAAAPALEALERDVPRLSTDDRERARRLSDPTEQRFRLTTYLALRVVLERSAGSAVRGQRFARSARGKPRLDGDGPAFSFSHTQRLALIAVAGLPAIGVDLEESRSLAMSPRRREEILAVGSGLSARLPGSAGSDAAVLRAWCRLEAYAKARGQGVSRVLTELGLRETCGRGLAIADIEAGARQPLPMRARWLLRGCAVSPRTPPPSTACWRPQVLAHCDNLQPLRGGGQAKPGLAFKIEIDLSHHAFFRTG